MANDVSVTPGVGAPIATDEVDNRHYQLVKIVAGAEGSEERIDGDEAFGLEVDVTRLPGTVAADLEAIKEAVEAPIALDTPTVNALAPIPFTDLLTALAGLQDALEGVLAVAGTVAVSNLPGTQPVSGTFWQATQPVSGPVTDAQLRATAVPVSGPLTDAQLRATPVPVSGTVTASGPLTDAQLRASAVPVELDAAALAALESVTVGGTVAVSSSALPTGAATSALQSTIAGHLDGVEALLATIDADTGALAGAVSGTEVQVDVLTLPALPAGSNAIGTVDTELPAAVAAADDLANPTAPQVLAHLMGYDPTDTNWDRLRLTNDATTYPGRLLVATTGSTTPTDAVVNTNVGFGVSQTGFSSLPAGALYLFNGATWDRVRGDVANGVDVDVTRLPELPAGTNAIGSVTTLPTAGAVTNRSGSITTGGTAQQAAASNASRKYLMIQNKTTASESFWFSTDATAVADSPSVEVPPGMTFLFEGTFVPSGAVSVIAATTGTKFTAKEA